VYLTFLDLAQRIVRGAVVDLDATLPLDEYQLPA
jgi:hypothetical protein